MVTIPLALAVGNQGKVFAYEPVAANATRLRENLRLNGLTHVVVHEIALGELDGEITLQLGSDPVFHSSTDVLGPWRTDESVRVPSRTLDAVWKADGRPSVSVVKVDVEGAELSVLKGGRELLAAERPALLLELLDATRDEVVGWLSDLGYRPSRPRGFAPWNYLFLPAT
jgi:FkbM family methyltransferase